VVKGNDRCTRRVKTTYLSEIMETIQLTVKVVSTSFMAMKAPTLLMEAKGYPSSATKITRCRKSSNDSIFGQSGMINLCGDAGNDLLGGNENNDLIDGGAGNISNLWGEITTLVLGVLARIYCSEI